MPERNKVLDEHRELIRHLSELDDLAQSTSRGEGWGRDLSRRAAELVEQLRAHFGGDAEGTFFFDVTKRSPHLLPKLTALTAEHPEILKEFREVAQAAAQLAAADSDAATRIAARTRRVIATLRRHEAEENELIFKTFWDDIGTKD